MVERLYALRKPNINNTHRQQPAHEGLIAFCSDRDGDPEIYLMNEDGSGVRKLTDNTSEDLAPDWSPDGSRIDFVSDRDGDYEIYKIESDESHPLRLTDHAGEDFHPCWSPDGTKIVFESFLEGPQDIYVMDFDGNNRQR